MLFILGETSWRTTIADTIATLPQATQRAAVSDFNSSLVAHYTFDDGTATDASGKGNNGTVNGAAQTTGKVGGGALQFDGVGSVVTVSQSPSLDTIYNNGGGGMSVSFWVRLNTLPSDADVLSLGYGSDTEWSVRIRSDRIYVGVNYDGATDLSDRFSNQVSVGTWSHFVMTWNGGSSQSDLTLYKDGSIQTYDYGSNGAGNPVDNPHEYMLIGSSYYPSTAALDGVLDDVRVYSKVLSASEISQLYQEGMVNTSTDPTITPPNTTVSSGSGAATPSPQEPSLPPPPPSGNRVDRLNTSGSRISSFTTIQACADVVQAGETCLVYAGAYDERVRVTHSGNASGPIVFAGLAGTKVKAFNLTQVGYITIKNFEITHQGFTTESPGSTAASFYLNTAQHISILDNTIHDTVWKCIQAHYWVVSPGVVSQTASHDIHIKGNTIYKCGSQRQGSSSAIFTYGDRNIIENNDISRLGADFVDAVGGNLNVIRNNTFHDNSLSDGPVGNDDHIDGVQNWCSPGALSTHWMLIEHNNMINAPSGNTHFTIFQDQGNCNESDVIIRYNTVSMIGNGFMINNQGVSGVRVYNNTAANDNVAGPANWTDVAYYDHYKVNKGATHGQVINNLWYNTVRDGGNQNWAQTADPTKNIGDSTIGFYANYNLGFNSWCGSACSWHNPSNGIDKEPNSIINKDPLFVSIVSNNFNLQPSSPAIDKGGPLTHALVAGNGTVIKVDEAGFFQDGWAGVGHDWISVGTTGNYSEIASIDYTTNTITLRTPLTWSLGAPVYLFKDSTGRQVLYGSAPDIGAFEYGSGTLTTTPTQPTTPAIPTPLTGDFNRDGAVNTLDFSLMVAVWNQSSPPHDLNKDGMVNSLDFSILVQNWTR
jgi:hypothetical protein